MDILTIPIECLEQDRIEAGERRWKAIGLTGGIVLLLVAHAIREQGRDVIVRIISARQAN